MESWVQRWRPRTNALCDFSTPPVESTAPATKNRCQVIRSAAPVTQNHLRKSTYLMLQNATPLRKSAPWPPNISDEHVFCTAPARRNASLQILSKCPTHAIGFGHATKPCTFCSLLTRCTIANATSERPKFLRTPQFFALLTSKCASHHNGVHFFDISTSKSGPKLVCFVHFHFEMCFAPQRRALFRHLKCQKWSAPLVFLTFWLGNVLRATKACKFSSLLWPAGSAPAALANLLFDPPEPQIIGKTQWIATFLPFRANPSSFFWLFLYLSLLWSSLFWSFSSLCLCPALLFIRPYPSIICIWLYNTGKYWKKGSRWIEQWHLQYVYIYDRLCMLSHYENGIPTISLLRQSQAPRGSVCVSPRRRRQHCGRSPGRSTDMNIWISV